MDPGDFLENPTALLPRLGGQTAAALIIVSRKRSYRGTAS
jgi:hypothetical protein